MSNRTQRVTREVLEMIPTWVDMGATPEDIADAVGVTPGSLRVICSHNGVRLATTGSMPRYLRQRLGSDKWEVLRAAAARRGVTVMMLVIDILSAVVSDELLEAVLDDDVRGA